MLRIVKVLLTLSFLFLVSGSAKAQNTGVLSNKYTIQFKGTPLQRALQEYVKLTDADLIYDPDFKLEHEVFLTAKNVSEQELLIGILKDSGFDYIILSSGTYVIVKEVIEQSRTGNLKGLITDSETGKPIEFASVYIAEAASGTFSKYDGSFSIPELVEGNYTLKINHTGYRELEIDYELNGNKAAKSNILSIELQPRVYLGDALVVNGSHRTMGITRNNNQSAETLSNFDIQPGSGILSSTQYFSGVDFDLANQQLSIQGSGSGDHVLNLDGVPVYDPYSVSLISSAFSPYAIDQISLKKAGFGVSEGSLLAGKIDVKQRYSAFGSKNLIVQTEPFSSNLSVTTPVKIGKMKLQVDATGRISMQELIPNQPLSRQINEWDRLDPLLQNFLMGSDDDIADYDVENQQSDFGFYDFHIAVSEKSNDFKETSFSAYFGGSTVRADLLSERNTLISSQPSLVYTREDASFSNSLLQIRHTDFSNAKFEWSTQVYFSSSRYGNQYVMMNTNHFGSPNSTEDLFNDLINRDMQDQSLNQNYIREYGVKAGFSYALNSRSSLDFGINPQYFDYNVELSDLFYSPTIDQSQVFHLNSFIESNTRLTDRISTTIGSRFTSLEMNNLYAEPRASIQFDLPDGNIGYSSFLLSGGIYRQFVNRFEVSNIGPSSLLPQYNFWIPSVDGSEIPLALHLSFSYKLETDQGLNLHAETFFKDIQRGLRLNYPALFSGTLTNTSFHSQTDYLQSYTGYARGYALTISKQFDEAGLFIETVYERTLSNMRLENQFNSELVPTIWNEPHRVKFFSRWNLGKRFDWINTALWVPVRFNGFRDAYYNFLPSHNAHSFGEYDLNDPSQMQLPYFFNLSTGIQYSQKVMSSDLKVRLDLQNITNRRNVMDYGLSPRLASAQNITFERYSRRFPGLIPTFSIEFSF